MDRFDKFGDDARRALTLAQTEAERLGHHYIGTEHLLLGLTLITYGAVPRVLERLRVDHWKVRTAVEFIVGGGERQSGEVGLTPQAKQVIELAITEARERGHSEIGSGHLLLGLVREGEGIAAGVLESLGVAYDAVVRAVESEIGPGGPGGSSRELERLAPRQLISSGSPWEERIGFSRAVRVGDRVVVSGTAPIWPDGSCDPDPERQARRCLEIIEAALEEAGASLGAVIRTRLYLTNAEDADAIGRAHADVFGETRPAATMVIVAGLLDARWKVEIEAEAQLG
jgi:enamine deaminase RidA (YjgF/YER057c/UK114 family)